MKAIRRYPVTSTGGLLHRARAAVLVAGVLLACPTSVFADAAARPPATVTGTVTAPLTIDETLLKSLPEVTVGVSFKTANGVEQGTYSGAPLWAVLNKAGLVNAPGKNTVLRHSVLVTGSDGYAVSIALGEIDPDYEGKQVILAYDGGKPASTYDDLRLVVPGDSHGGRSVKDVASIEVR